MTPGKVSVIIPARNERFLQATIDSLLAGASGDVEILACLDGYWPDPPLREDPRVRQLHWSEPQGMRPCENVAASVATGEFLMKVDAHVILGEGYDEILKTDCDVDWVVVPTRHSIDPTTWTVLRRDYNYSILTYPFLPSMYGMGFHAVTLPQALNRAVNDERADRLIDDIIAAQGSVWFQRRDYFLSFPPLDHEKLYFYSENQEITLRVLASGGRSVINRKTFAAHLHKGRENKGADGRVGRGFYLDVRKKRATEALMTDWCTRGWPSEWPNASRSFESMVEQHWWLISRVIDPRYAWPSDWRDWEKHRTIFEQRPPEAIPAHT